jgi:ubiquitin conjugation factor E4 B
VLTIDCLLVGLATNEPRSIHVLVMKLVNDTLLLQPDLLDDLMLFVSAAANSLLFALTSAADASSSSVASSQDWVLPASSLTPRQCRILQHIPEHFLDDLCTVLYVVGKVEPSYLSRKPLNGVLSLLVFFLRRPSVVQSPHLRAKIGDVLFQCFIPHSCRSTPSAGDYWIQLTPHNANSAMFTGPQQQLLEGDVECIQFLAPSLLLLYGDVEKTGFYDKLKYRRSIMIVLKHLWSLPQHRDAFRGIACVSSSSSSSPQHTTTAGASSSSSSAASSASPTLVEDGHNNYFIRFANGLMNETNALVTTTMEKLSEIKKAQTIMRNENGEWAAMAQVSSFVSNTAFEGWRIHLK